MCRFAAIDISKISLLHRSGFGIIMPFRESGAMAQRGEIQCAERQFALQSGRFGNVESSQLATLCRGSAIALASLCVPVRQSLQPPKDTKRGFSWSRFSFDRYVAETKKGLYGKPKEIRCFHILSTQWRRGYGSIALRATREIGLQRRVRY